MKRKYVSVLVVLCLVLTFAGGCAGNGTPQSSGDSPGSQGAAAAAGGENQGTAGEKKDPVSQTGENSGAAYQPDTGDTGSPATPDLPGDSVDVDLTRLSSTMVFAEVYNILDSPESYIGKTMKILGTYYAFGVEEADLYLHFIIIADAASCCAQGLQFMLSGERTYPEDYPDDYDSIEITGVYQRHDGNSTTGYYLLVDDITILS